MLPKFPNFKKLEIADQNDVEAITLRYPPYSDFNFVSLWSYNTLDLCEITEINHNFCMKFTDYITNEPFITFIGSNEIENTIDTLLGFTQQDNFLKELKLIPEVNLENIPDNVRNKYTVIEDPSNFDYILSVEKISTLVGNKYDGHRNLIKRFHNNFPENKIKKLDLTDSVVQKDINEVFQTWGINKNKSQEEIETEKAAINRLLQHADKFNFIAVGIYYQNRLIGFSIEEGVQNRYVMAHFGKADKNFIGIFQVLEHESSKILKDSGYEFINYEQDLGIENLRKSKQLWHPTGYLKKYKISKL